MAVHRPWRDIPSARIWDEACQREAEENRGRQIIYMRGGFIGTHKVKSSVEEYAARIGRELTAYHSLPKANLELFTTRAVKLRSLAKTAANFVAGYSWELEKLTWTDRLKRDSKQHLARIALTIQNRGLAKADYLDALRNFYSSGREGSTTESIIEVLTRQQQKNTNTVQLVPGVRLEKLDPFHRTFEGQVSQQNGKLILAGYTPLAEAFQNWLGEYNKDPEGVPYFYIWLEQDELCTSDWDPSPKELNSVKYGDSNLTWCKIPLAGSPVYWKDSSGAGEKQLADTTVNRDQGEQWHKYYREYTLNGQKSKVGGAAAYVWDTMDTIFVFAHISNEQHHSSGRQGEIVRCAGNIIIENGNITYVDGDSGHYKPEQGHLRKFCTWLEQYYGLRGDTVVGWYDGGFVHTTWAKLKWGFKPSKGLKRLDLLS